MKNVELMDMVINEIDKNIDDIYIDLSTKMAITLENLLSYYPVAAIIDYITEAVDEKSEIPVDKEVSPHEFEVIYCLTILEIMKDPEIFHKIKDKFENVSRKSPVKPETLFEHYDYNEKIDFKKFYLALLRASILVLQKETKPTEIDEFLSKYTEYERDFRIYIAKLKGSCLYLKELSDELANNVLQKMKKELKKYGIFLEINEKGGYQEFMRLLANITIQSIESEDSDRELH